MLGRVGGSRTVKLCCERAITQIEHSIRRGGGATYIKTEVILIHHIRKTVQIRGVCNWRRALEPNKELLRGYREWNQNDDNQKQETLL